MLLTVSLRWPQSSARTPQEKCASSLTSLERKDGLNAIFAWWKLVEDRRPSSTYLPPLISCRFKRVEVVEDKSPFFERGNKFRGSPTSAGFAFVGAESATSTPSATNPRPCNFLVAKQLDKKSRKSRIAAMFSNLPDFFNRNLTDV